MNDALQCLSILNYRFLKFVLQQKIFDMNIFEVRRILGLLAEKRLKTKPAERIILKFIGKAIIVNPHVGLLTVSKIDMEVEANIGSTPFSII